MTAARLHFDTGIIQVYDVRGVEKNMVNYCAAYST